MTKITKEMIDEAEKQIEERRKEIDYDTRDYSILSLMEINRETVLFLRAVLDGMQDYYDNKQYLIQETAI